MEVQLQFLDCDEEGRQALIDDLSITKGVRGRIRPVRQLPPTGVMGSWADTISIAIGSGGAITALVTTLSAWVQRQRKSTIVVEFISGEQAHRIKIDTADPESAERLLLTAAPIAQAMHDPTSTHKE